MNAILQQMVWCILGVGLFTGLYSFIERRAPRIVTLILNQAAIGVLVVAIVKIALETLT